MKKFIYGTIFGLIISGSIVFAANYLYKADEVSYDPKDTNWSVDNVDSAIKELYNKINDANSALIALKNTNIAKAVGANGDTFTSVINKLGTITDQKNKSFTVSNTSSITIPAGYYNGQGTINVSGLVPAPTGTFTPSAHGTQIDMGANNTYRYINTTNVWNQAVAAADARANANSANYQAGYNAGKSSVNIGWTSLVYKIDKEASNYGTHTLTLPAGYKQYLILAFTNSSASASWSSPLSGTLFNNENVSLGGHVLMGVLNGNGSNSSVTINQSGSWWRFIVVYGLQTS